MIEAPKVSSSVFIGELSSEINIDSVYDNIELSDEIVKIKCNNKQKTKTQELECKTFYNQISFHLKNKNVIKIFNNGKFHISGVKSLSDAEDNLNKIIQEIKKIRGAREITSEQKFGLNTFRNKILSKLTEDFYVLKNEIKINKILINSKECEVWGLNKDLYIETKHIERIKKIYNNMCVEVGYAKIDIKRKLKIIKLKGCKYTKKEENLYEIHDRFGNYIGDLVIVYNGADITKVTLDKVNIHKNACDLDVTVKEMKLANSNYNSSVGYKIERNEVCKYLDNNNVKYTYDPCSYPGVKFILDDVKITVFRTGSVIFSSKVDIHKEAFPFVQKMFTNFTQKEEIRIVDEELSIWDI